MRFCTNQANNYPPRAVYSHFTCKPGSRIIAGLDQSHGTAPDADKEPRGLKFENAGRLNN